MKRIVYLTCIGTLALTLTSWGAPRNKGGHGSARGGGARSAHVVSPRSGGGHSVARANRAPRSSHLSATRARTHAAERRTVTRNRAALGHERNVARTTTRRSARVDAARAGSSQLRGEPPKPRPKRAVRELRVVRRELRSGTGRR